MGGYNPRSIKKPCIQNKKEAFSDSIFPFSTN